MDRLGQVVLAALGLLVIALIVAYNRLVRLRNRVDAGWAQIDVQPKRRHDLIPNLVETVKGYAGHERATLETVVQARRQAVSAARVDEQAQAQGALTRTLRQLLALAEAYPDLKANQSFLALQEELTGTESRIAYARQFYNEQVMAYGTALQSFPTNFLASAFGFTPRAYFEAETASRSSAWSSCSRLPSSRSSCSSPFRGAGNPSPTWTACS